MCHEGCSELTHCWHRLLDTDAEAHMELVPSHAHNANLHRVSQTNGSADTCRHQSPSRARPAVLSPALWQACLVACAETHGQGCTTSK